MIGCRATTTKLAMNCRQIATSLLAALVCAASAAAPAADSPRNVKDVDAVPYLNAAGKEAYRKWTFSPYNRAFAINPANGNWGVFPNDDDLFRMQQVGAGPEALRRQAMRYAIEDALNRCQKQAGDKCFIYAQNGDVVWTGGAAPPAGVAQSPPVPAAAPQAQPPVAAAEPRQPDPQAKPAAPRQPAAAVPASSRKALVFGNDRYQNITGLTNARMDARSIAAALADLGFSVHAHFDLGERDMKKAIRDFTASINGGDEVVFFFAGHGVQIGSANYLLPVDIRAENAASVRDEAIALQRVLDDLGEARARLTLAVIDACRDNPFKGSGRAIGGSGLAPTSPATGQMIMFSAGAGQQAMDRLGPEDNSPNGLFTRVFLKHLKEKGVSVDRMMREIRAEVVALAKSAGHDQVPAIYDQVVGDFYLSR